MATKNGKTTKAADTLSEQDKAILEQAQGDPQAELIALRNRVQELEQKNEQLLQGQGSYAEEMAKLKNVKGKGLNEIQYKEIAPPSVALWHVSGHNVGKRVGPIHPDNAEETFLRFSFFGIKLSLTKPTEAFLEAYKKTAEYKNSADKEAKRRAGKSKTNKKSEVERLTEAIARMQGVPKEELNSIKDPNEVHAGARA